MCVLWTVTVLYLFYFRETIMPFPKMENGIHYYAYFFKNIILEWQIVS